MMRMVQRSPRTSAAVHFHALITDGVFVQDDAGDLTFHQLPAPTSAEVEEVSTETCRRAREVLIRHGRWQDDAECVADEPSWDSE